MTTHLTTVLRRLSGGALVLAIAVAANPAPAEDLLDGFYEGKRLELVVGSGPGGGYDTYARMLARHMGRYIPGKPAFTVKNMPGTGKEGMGSVQAANYIFNFAPQDGTVIAALQRNIAIAQIMGQTGKGPGFKADKLNWLGSLNNEVGVIAVMARSRITSIETATRHDVTMGSTGPNDTQFYPALLNNTLGTKFRLVTGYSSTAQIQEAMEGGQVEGVSQSWASYENRSKSGPSLLLAQIGLKPLPILQKLGVPLLSDLITEENLQPGYTLEEVRAIFRLLLTTKTMGRPYAVGPDVPRDRLSVLRTAFAYASDDGALLAEARKEGREVNLVTGEEIQEIVNSISTASKATIAKLEEAIKYRGPVQTAEMELPEHTGEVVQVREGGRWVVIDHKGKKIAVRLSGSRTEVTVNGQKVQRSDVKTGMTCTLVYPRPGAEANSVNCQS